MNYITEQLNWNNDVYPQWQFPIYYIIYNNTGQAYCVCLLFKKQIFNTLITFLIGSKVFICKECTLCL